MTIKTATGTRLEMFDDTSGEWVTLGEITYVKGEVVKGTTEYVLPDAIDAACRVVATRPFSEDPK